jgi:hypothetical protein
MTTGTLTAPPRGAGWRFPAANSAAWPLAAIGALLLVQFSMIFAKSFNWDEFLHYSMVQQLREDTLARPFQTLLARLLLWAPSVSDELVAQMMAARVFVWSAFLVGLGSLYGLARRFVSREDALWTTLVYLAAGDVFVHGFAIRADPPAMAALMLALYLLASRRLGWTTILAVGALIGLAGMITVKAVFYAPCFAGIAWLRLSQAEDKRRALLWLAAIAPVAATAFAGLYLFHRAGLAPPPPSQEGGSFLRNGLQWLTDGLLRQPRHTLIAFLTAPVFVYALVKAPAAWRNGGASRDRTIAFVGLCLPLLVILFYRNVFPYFFVFILAPVAVALAPAVAELRKRHGTLLLLAALCTVPVIKFVAEPRDVIERQRAMIDYVHRQFPPGTVSLDYCGMVADYPRVIDHLVSGIGLANYNKRGVPLVARAVENGSLAFVIENRRAISMGLAGKTGAEGLLPADVASLHGNFVRAWGLIWLAGEEIPAGADQVAIDVPHLGAYTPDGNLIVDGTGYRRGEIVELSEGRHIVTGERTRRTVLWRGERLPAAPPQTPPGLVFTEF